MTNFVKLILALLSFNAANAYSYNIICFQDRGPGIIKAQVEGSNVKKVIFLPKEDGEYMKSFDKILPWENRFFNIMDSEEVKIYLDFPQFADIAFPQFTNIANLEYHEPGRGYSLDPIKLKFSCEPNNENTTICGYRADGGSREVMLLKTCAKYLCCSDVKQCVEMNPRPATLIDCGKSYSKSGDVLECIYQDMMEN